jgi:hypothetical protein
MGFIDDKNNIVQQLNLTEVLGDLPENKLISNIASVRSSSKNLIPFLLDLLGQTCRDKKNLPNLKDRLKCDLIRIVIEILVEFFPELMRILKEGIVKGIKAALLCPASFKIPNPAPTLELKPSEFDTTKLMALDPNGFPGNLFFGDAENDLNIFLANLIQSGVGSSGVWKNIMDFEVIDYPITTGLNTTNTLGIRATINSSYIGQEYDVFLKDYINSIELFNFKNFIPNLMEELNGMLSSFLANSDLNVNGGFSGNFKIGLNEAIAKERVNKMIEKILDTDPCDQTFKLNDSFFEFDSDELLEIEKNAQNRVAGQKMVNYSCEPTLINNNGFDRILEDFSTNLAQSSGSTESAKLVTREFTESVINNLSNQATGEPNDSPEGRGRISVDANINKAISYELTLALPKLSTSVIFTPKITVLLQTSKKLITNTFEEWGDNFVFAVANKVFFEYVVRESGAALLKIIFEQIKEEIQKIVAELALGLIKESVDKRIKQIKSLTGGYNVGSGLSAIGLPDTSQFI